MKPAAQGYVVLVAAAASISAAVWLVSGTTNPWNLLFAFTLLTGVLILFRMAWSAGGDAASARVEAERFRQVDPAAARQLAVAQERARLAADIEAAVRATVTRMAGLVDTAAKSWDDDPTPHLRAIADLGRMATHELRRMLGLLRTDPSPTIGHSSEAAPIEALRRPDVVLAGSAVVLAVAERWMYGVLPEPAEPFSLAFTVLAAGTVLLRCTRPITGAVTCGALLAAAQVLDVAVLAGLWTLATCGTLAWATVARGGVLGYAGFLALLSGATFAAARQDFGNEGVVVSILLVAGGGGAIVKRARSRAVSDGAAADRLRSDLERVRDEAVAAERLKVARELHDLVSHAVSVMVMQAGAAEVLHRRDPDAARRPLAVIAETAAGALTELDRLVASIEGGAIGGSAPDAGSAARTEADILAVVERLRSAGLDVRFEWSGMLPPQIANVVHRIIQEALTNVLRHGKATRADVRIACDATAVCVTIADDGSGAAGQTGSGFGLTGLAERVRGENGELHVGSGPGGAGFVVSATIPVQHGIEVLS